MTTYISTINIPAYDSSGNGLVVMLRLTAVINEIPSIMAIGNIAIALKPNFKRIIDIMSSLKQSWVCFLNYKYVIESDNENFLVRDSKSSSMAICIALFNLSREMHAKSQIQGLSGTGILRIDGSFENAHNETAKHQAALQSEFHLNQFITSSECKHLYDLEQLMS